VTLNTELRIREAVDIQAVFDRVLADLIAVSDPTVTHHWKRTENRIGTDLGQGLSALMWVTCGPDGGELERNDHPEYADKDDDGLDHSPAAHVAVNWDTSYAYQDQFGGCGVLHARLIVELGRWLDQQGLTWSWQYEFTGDWYIGYAGLDTLLESADAGVKWFKSIMPALLADAARKTNR